MLAPNAVSFLMKSADEECRNLRKKFPSLVIFGNIGLSQAIVTPADEIQSLVDSLSAEFLVVHTNPLQEVIQREGTPQFQGGMEALGNLCEKISVPVV